ncbi:hypothetical protein YPPY63_4322, partial [Yersinia pestis PY-63]
MSSQHRANQGACRRDCGEV